MQYFYILKFDGGIFEIPYTESKHKSTIEALTKGGVAAIKDANNELLVFNSGTISNILTENQYDAHLDTTNPKKYIMRGVWYDKKGEVVRYEKWKQNLIDERKQKRLSEQKRLSPKEELEARQRIAEMMRDAGGILKNKKRSYT